MSSDRESFTQSFRSLQRGALLGGLVAVVTSLGMMLALFPAAEAIRNFFRTQIGGNLGELLLGISFPMMASPPILILVVWIWRRCKDPNLLCDECGYSFASATIFKRMLETSRCPKCDAEQFLDDRE